MGTQEVIINNPKRDAVDSAIFCAVTAGDAVGLLKCAVQAFNELLEWAKFLRQTLQKNDVLKAINFDESWFSILKD